MEIDREYLELDVKIMEIEKQKNIDTNLIIIKDYITKLTEKQSKIEDVYNQRLQPLLARRGELLTDFENLYDGTKKKQFGLLMFSYRITKSVKVLKPVSVVETLLKIDKVEEGVKSFSLLFLRKLVDANVFSEDIVKLEEKVNIKVEEVKKQ
ncbi:hypothetical protein KAW18_02940 [candidate division WOR-3 bacterium]|nr:hypothetical protein [candidate division WOR-3 bacterium]